MTRAAIAAAAFALASSACGAPPAPAALAIRTQALAASPHCPHADALLESLHPWLELDEPSTGRLRVRFCELAVDPDHLVTGTCLVPGGADVVLHLLYGRPDARLADLTLRFADWALGPLDPADADGVQLDFRLAALDARFDDDRDGLTNLAEVCLGTDPLVASPISSTLATPPASPAVAAAAAPAQLVGRAMNR